MDIIKELSIILGILFTGELIKNLTGIFLPGNVIGMLLLFLLLLTKIVKIKQIEKVSNFFLNNLTIFFIPAGVGILKYYDLIQGRLAAFLGIVVVSTILVMIFTGYLVQCTQRIVKKWR